MGIRVQNASTAEVQCPFRPKTFQSFGALSSCSKAATTEGAIEPFAKLAIPIKQMINTLHFGQLVDSAVDSAGRGDIRLALWTFPMASMVEQSDSRPDHGTLVSCMLRGQWIPESSSMQSEHP